VVAAVLEAATMKRTNKEAVPSAVPKLPELEQAKHAVLNTLDSIRSRQVPN
jgi:hypothetical protein